eukprot:COSAG02_NODE_23_length_52893_cov_58.101868_18_plen_164_part_00
MSQFQTLQFSMTRIVGGARERETSYRTKWTGRAKFGYLQISPRKEQWERCKTHQVGDKGFKTVAPGTMVRNRAQGAQALGDELHKKITCERFNKCWQEQKQQLAIPNTKGRAKRKATYTIEFPQCHGLLSKDGYTLHVNVVKAYADFKATTDRDAYQHRPFRA